MSKSKKVSDALKKVSGPVDWKKAREATKDMKFKCGGKAKKKK